MALGQPVDRDVELEDSRLPRARQTEVSPGRPMGLMVGAHIEDVPYRRLLQETGDVASQVVDDGNATSGQTSGQVERRRSESLDVEGAIG
jgi:hypothetical protein